MSCPPLRCPIVLLICFTSLGNLPVWPAAAQGQVPSGQALPPRVHSASQANSAGIGFQLLEAAPAHVESLGSAPEVAAASSAPVIEEIPEDVVFEFRATAPPPPQNRAMELLARPREQFEILPKTLAAPPNPIARTAFQQVDLGLGYPNPPVANQEPANDESDSPKRPLGPDSLLENSVVQDTLPPPADERPLGLREIQFIERTPAGAAADMSTAYPTMVSIPAVESSTGPVTPRTVEWKASNLRYRRLYFEQVLLERHGLSRRPLVQTAYSTGRFFSTAAFLPGFLLARSRFDLFDHRAMGHSGSPLDDESISAQRSEADYAPLGSAEAFSDPAPGAPGVTDMLAPNVGSEPLEVIESLEVPEGNSEPGRFDADEDWDE